EHVLESLARTPIGRLEPIASAVHRWDPMLPQFHAGYLRHLAAFSARTDRSPRLAFAGDYLIGPYTEMALTSGMRAATEVGRGLPAPVRQAEAAGADRRRRRDRGVVQLPPRGGRCALAARGERDPNMGGRRVPRPAALVHRGSAGRRPDRGSARPGGAGPSQPAFVHLPRVWPRVEARRGCAVERRRPSACSRSRRPGASVARRLSPLAPPAPPWHSAPRRCTGFDPPRRSPP